MTVSTNTPRDEYTGNGVTTAFPTTFQFISSGDIDVYQNTVLKTINTHYTVTGGSGSTGTVTFITAPGNGQDVILVNNPDITQETDYVENDPFPAETHELALDKLTLIEQRTRDIAERSIRVADSLTDSPTADLTLPIAEDRASTYLAFDQNGDVSLQAFSSATTPSGVVIRQRFTGDDSTVQFTLAGAPGAAGGSTMVYVGGNYQNRDTWSISGTTLAFTEAPVTPHDGSENIEVVSLSTYNIGTTNADSVTYTPSVNPVTTVQEAIRSIDSVLAGTTPTTTLDINGGAIDGTAIGATTPAAGKFTNCLATAQVGYTTGAGSTVTQATNRTTAVTINAICGTITTDTTSLAAGASAAFTVNNNKVAIGDVVVVSQRSGSSNVAGTAGTTHVHVVTVAAGSFIISVDNQSTTTAEIGAIIINFAVIKAVTS